MAGTAGVRFTVTNASGTEVGSCTTLAVGTCTVSVANGHTYTVTQAAAPGGWFTSHDLGVGTAASLAAANYSRVSVQVPSGGGAISVPPTGTSSNTNNAYRSGVWAVSRDNPPAPAACGLNVALLFDLSGSIAPNLARYKAAAEGFITALRGTPSAVALYTFASNARAELHRRRQLPAHPGHHRAGCGSAHRADPRVHRDRRHQLGPGHLAGRRLRPALRHRG